MKSLAAVVSVLLSANALAAWTWDAENKILSDETGWQIPGSIKNENQLTFTGAATAGTATDLDFSSLDGTDPNTTPANLQLVELYQKIFKGMTAIQTVKFPATVKKVGANAYQSNSGVFQGCTSLTTVLMPGVTSLGRDVFSGCSSLSSVSLPRVQVIANQTFASCTSLETIVLPSLMSIAGSDTSHFLKCSSLKNVSLPKLQEISAKAIFAQCGALPQFKLSYCMTTNLCTQPWAYYGVGSLKTIAVHSSSPLGEALQAERDGTASTTYESSLKNALNSPSIPLYGGSNVVDGVVWYYDDLDLPAGSLFEGGVTILGMARTDTATEIVVPSELTVSAGETLVTTNVTAIGAGAFLGDTSFTRISIPKTVKDIGQAAFLDCAKGLVIELGNAALEPTLIAEYGDAIRIAKKGFRIILR